MRGKILAIVCVSVLLGNPYVLLGGTFDFNGLDSNQDGKIDLSEINSFVQEDIQGAFSLLDKNGDGSVEKEEFQAVFFKFFDFNTIDANADGKITREELTTFIVNLHSERFGLSDLDNNASLDANEFKVGRFLTPWVWLSPINMFLGKVVSVNKDAKTMVLNVWVEREFYPSAKGMVLKEYLIDKKNIRFDISQAKSEGNGEVSRKDTVQVIYGKNGDNYIAYGILKIENNE
jgi:Ca2+-binding EF-hand superfamily protein